MVKKRQFNKKIILAIILMFLGSLIISTNSNSYTQAKISPKTSETYLVWERSFTNGPDYIAISDDGKYIAAAEIYEDYVVLIDSITQNIIWNYSFSSGINIRDMDMSANGEYVIVGCDNNYVYIFNNTPDASKEAFWSYDTGELVTTVAISAEGNLAVAGTSGTNNYVILFNVTKPSDPFIWQSPESTVGIDALAISKNGTYIAATADTTLYMYNKSSSSAQWGVSTSGYKELIAISGDGKYVVTGGSSGYVYLYDSSSSSYLWYDSGLGGEIKSIDMSEDGEYFVIGGDNSMCYLFNKTGPTPERRYTVDTTYDVYSVSISNDGNYVAVGYEYSDVVGPNTIYFYERTSSDALWRYNSLTSINKVALSADGSYLAASEGGIGTQLYFMTPLSSLPDPYSLSTTHSIVGKTFVYEVIEWNQTLGDSLDIALSDIDPTAGVGLQRCYEITQITRMSNYWIIYYKVWNWGMDFNTNTVYGFSIYVYVYPIDRGSDVYYIHSDLMSIIPKPVGTYLAGIDWGSDSSSSGSSYSYLKSQSSYNFNLTVEYSAEGFLNSLIWTYNDMLLLNISYMGERSSAPSSIPFGEFYLGITVSTIVVLIIIVNQNRTKMKNKREFNRFES